MGLREIGETVPCSWCGRPTTFLGTEHCDPCHQLLIRIQSNPKMAGQMLEHVNKDRMLSDRMHRLMPHGAPRYVRVYDNQETADRYTVVFTGLYPKGTMGRQRYTYLGMSERPNHPQGFCQHGESSYIIDRDHGKWPVQIGKKHESLGLRIKFNDLPEQCKVAAITTYKALWRIHEDNENGPV